MPDATTHCDIAIAGGGLAGCLIALALAERQPQLDVRIVEAGAALGGNHVWSFFSSDVSDADRWLIAPLIVHEWQDYDVLFPKLKRTMSATYNSITSDRLDAHVRQVLPAERIIRAEVADVTPDRITLADGQAVTARLTIDARGAGDLSTLKLGWQKFVGQKVHVPGGHGLTRPIVMDATVEQIDGYRFVYCLPFDAETVFIEDTYYSDTPDLDVPAIRERIIAYAAAKGWQTNGGGHEETGVLPVIIGGDFDAYWRSTGTGIAKAGIRSGMCQPTTGYTLPDAVRLATRLAANPDMTPDQFEALARRHWKARGYYRLLDTMLFGAAVPNQRYRIFERFYGLSASLIERFYAGQSTLLDKARILTGKPPVPVIRAVRAIWGLRK